MKCVSVWRERQEKERLEKERREERRQEEGRGREEGSGTKNETYKW